MGNECRSSVGSNGENRSFLRRKRRYFQLKVKALGSFLRSKNKSSFFQREGIRISPNLSLAAALFFPFASSSLFLVLLMGKRGLRI